MFSVQFRGWIPQKPRIFTVLCQSYRRLDTRAGSYRRTLHTKAGEVDLQVPRLRKLPFESQIIERYRQADIVVHGPKPQSQLPWYYSQGTIFCLPSIEDGMGYVLLEAKACGLPVICTTNTGAEDIVREGIDGFVVPIRDVDALKTRILWAYDHRSLCSEMGRVARENALLGNRWDDYGDRILAAYGRLVENKTHLLTHS